MSLITCDRGCAHFGRWGAAGVLLLSGDLVLLQLRANSHHSGTWSTPGGSLDRGETPVQAALREVQEELVGAYPRGWIRRSCTSRTTVAGPIARTTVTSIGPSRSGPATRSPRRWSGSRPMRYAGSPCIRASLPLGRS